MKNHQDGQRSVQSLAEAAQRIARQLLAISAGMEPDSRPLSADLLANLAMLRTALMIASDKTVDIAGELRHDQGFARRAHSN